MNGSIFLSVRQCLGAVKHMAMSKWCAVLRCVTCSVIMFLKSKCTIAAFLAIVTVLIYFQISGDTTYLVFTVRRFQKIKRNDEGTIRAPLSSAQTKPSQGFIGSEFVVLYNHIQANKSYGPMDTVTLVTQGDYSFMDNLGPLIERWQAPISLAVFAPGTDYEIAMKHAHYYKRCSRQHRLVNAYVDFHFFFPVNHMTTLIYKVNSMVPRLKCRVLGRSLQR